MSAGLPPLGLGYDVENAEQQAELEAFMRSVYPQGVPQAPAPLEPQPVRFGRFNIPGGGFDAASVAILQQLQNARRPRNFGEGLVQGALGSLAGGRARGMEQRQAEYERKQKEADTAVSTRAGMARSLAARRWEMARQKAKESEDTELVTPGLVERLGKQDIFIDPSLIGKRVSRGVLVRDRPIDRPVPTLSTEARKFWGQRAVATGGTFPSGISRNPRLVSQILEETAAEGAKAGMSGYDMARAAATYKSDTGSLTKLTATHDAASAFEGMVHKNSDILRGVMKKLKDSGVTWANRPVRALVSGLGSVDQAKFRAQLVPLQTEFARLITSPNLTGVLTNEARNEIQSVLSGSYTIPQLEGALEILELDATNRVKAYEDRLGIVRGRIGRPGGPLTAPEDESFLDQPALEPDTVAVPLKNNSAGAEFLKRLADIRGKKKP